MNNIRLFNGYHANIIRFKNYINKNYTGDNKNELLQIMFNSTMSFFPNEKWYTFENNFFDKLPAKDLESMMIYTILTYKMGKTFLNLDDIIISELIKTFVNENINPYKMERYAKILTQEKLLKKTLYGYNNHYIKPRHIYKIIIDNYDLNNLEKNIDEIIKKIDKFIKEHEIKIFDENYTFFNIYKSLKKLTTLDFFEENISVLELIPLFNTIQDEEIKINIQLDFARIEKSDKPLQEKIEDCLTVAYHYSYDLPIAQKKRNRSS